MKIAPIGINNCSSNIHKSSQTHQTSFTGLKNPAAKCMFVFDLDGTFAQGTKVEINKLLEIARQRNAVLIYNTGRAKKEVEALQLAKAKEGIILPQPEYLVCNNGQFIYENVDGILVKDEQYEAKLKADTNFDSQKVLLAMKQLANSKKYAFSPYETERIKNLKYADISGNDAELRAKDQSENCYDEIKSTDPDFYNSKISYYKWNPSVFMSEYFVGEGVSLRTLEDSIEVALRQLGIKTKFIENVFSKKRMDKYDKNILLQSHPLRRHEKGSMTALFLCPADKADGVKYLRTKLEIPNNEILMAGNDDNDVSLARMAEEGATFIYVNGARGSKSSLDRLCDRIKTTCKNIYIAQCSDAKGILEGLSKMFGIQ